MTEFVVHTEQFSRWLPSLLIQRRSCNAIVILCVVVSVEIDGTWVGDTFHSLHARKEVEFRRLHRHLLRWLPLARYRFRRVIMHTWIITCLQAGHCEALIPGGRVQCENVLSVDGNRPNCPSMIPLQDCSVVQGEATGAISSLCPMLGAEQSMLPIRNII